MRVYIIGAGPGDPKLLTLRGAELIASCPVVLYTGNSERLRQEDLDAAGVRTVLAKPVEPDQLYGLLRSLLP